MKKFLFLYFLISLIYCEEFMTLKKDKLYNDKCALYFFNNETNSSTLILNSESKCLDKCTIYESYSLNEVFDGFCYNIFNEYKLTGENYNGNYDCFSNICENNKCKGKLENEECYEHGECDVGLYCYEYEICEKLKDEGEDCSDLKEDFLGNMNDNCYAGLVCNKGKCVKLGSLSYNEEEKIDNEFSCKSGVEKDDHCIDSISEKIIEESTENQCSILYKYGDKQVYEIEECEFNLIGKKVAGKNILFNNFQNYVNEYNKLLNEKQKKNIHLLNKLSLGNKSLMNKYLDSIIGYSFTAIDNDYRIFFYNNYFNLH